MSTVTLIREDIEYLVPLISFLGSNPYWWARSAPSIAQELALDAARVDQVFERYPMIFRRSRFIEESNAYSYALQMRYAQRKDGSLEELGQVTNLPVLSEAEIIALLDFLLRISTLEGTLAVSRRNSTVAMLAAVISAFTALMVAVLK